VHLALARKYRPKQFADLIGQDHVARGLRGALEQGRVAHGYLFAGPRGVGKTTAARILAMALNCDTRHAKAAAVPTEPLAGSKGGNASPGAPAPGEPCGACTSCQRIWSGAASLDVVEIDAASNRGVEDARDLRERAMYAASQEGRHKVYIVDEAHMLTREAWNTLLKVLEEPPPGVVFVFATTEPHKITNTAAPVMSRLQRFDFRRVGPQAIASRLAEVARAESIEVDDDAIDLISRLADGGMRDGLSVLDQVSAFGEGPITDARVREALGLVGDEVYAELLDLVADRRPEEVFPLVARLIEAGVDLVAFADGAAELWRAVLAVRLGAAPTGVSHRLAAHLERVSPRFSPGDVLRILRALQDAEEPIRRGAAPQLALETLLVRWATMDRTVEIAELLRVGAAATTASSRSGDPAPAVRAAAGPPRERTDLRDSSAPAGQRERDPASQAGPVTPAAVSAVRGAPATGPLQLDLELVRSSWPEVVEGLRAERKMFIADALASAVPIALEDGVIRLHLPEDSPVSADGLGRSRQAVEEVLARVFGMGLRLALERAGGTPSGPSSEDAGRSRRLSASGARAERMRALRGKDPALDSAMDALDLELLE
jgi:DNA polymerase-3 subunit gamma/tau